MLDDCRPRLPPSTEVDCLVVGAGAAGLTAAQFAAHAMTETGGNEPHILVLEKNTQAGRKILISGGTRCNVLPASLDIQRDFFTESSASALRAVFSTWSLDDCAEWLETEVGLAMTLEEETGKLFPASNSAAEVRDLLVAACRARGVRFQYGAGIVGLGRLPGEDGRWVASLTDGRRVEAARVVLATGGKSFANLGTTGDGWRVLQQLGHTLHAPYPALTPLLGTHPGGAQLAGISLYSAQVTATPAAAAAGAKRGGGAKRAQRAERSDILLTHRGYSGPGILDVSHSVTMAAERGQQQPAVGVRWTDDDQAAWEQRLTASSGSMLVVSVLRRGGLPQRLAEALAADAGLPLGRKLAELRKAERQTLLAALTGWRLPVSGHEGYPKAEVTGGGLPLSEVDCRTLESRVEPGLHVCGELLDVFGRIGGFNFYWAWLTGRAAGLAAGKSATMAPQALPSQEV